jgi:hypothetical protein
VTGSNIPIEPVESNDERRSKWLGGEAHVGYAGDRSFSRRRQWANRLTKANPVALGLAFLVGGLIGAALTGLARRTPADAQAFLPH